MKKSCFSFRRGFVPAAAKASPENQISLVLNIASRNARTIPRGISLQIYTISNNRISPNSHEK